MEVAGGGGGGVGVEEVAKWARVFLSWRDVSVKVKVRLGNSRFLLQDVSGYAEPGSLVAIMGSSGCGKTTLLNALAGRLGNAILERGEILTNGTRQRLVYGNLAYVTQDDSLIPTLSVYETMMYAAHLQLPSSMSTYDKQVQVHRVIREMGLQACVNTRVGGWHIRGLSGGEKRRLSIAIETIKQPSLLFLDEPTSGLDSAASIHVIKRLKALAKTGRTVVISIHQPSSESFEMIDVLSLLYRGRTVFFGARAETKRFYDSAGFPCPTFRNPSDHFLWVINSDFDEMHYHNPDMEESSEGPNRAQNAQTLIKCYKDSNSHSFVNAKIRHTLGKECEVLKCASKGPDFYSQAFHLTCRSFKHMCRDLTYYWFRLCVYVMLSIVLGTIYFQVGVTYNAIQARASLLMFLTAFLSLMGVMSFPSFIEDMKIFTRERLNGHYGVAAFAIANTVSSFPFIVLISFIPGSLVYALAGLHPGLDHFIFFFASLLACLGATEGLLMSVASLVPDYLSGMMAGCGIMGIYSLTGGFFRFHDELPKPIWRYPFSYISFNTWSNRALYNNDFHGLFFDNIVPGAPLIPGDEIVEMRFHMSISYSKWWATFVLVCMTVFYRVLFFFAMKLRENLPRIRHKLRHKKVVVMTEKAFSGRLVAFSGRLQIPFSGKIVAPSDTEMDQEEVDLLRVLSCRKKSNQLSCKKSNNAPYHLHNMESEAVPYEYITLGNGKVTRRCIANDACREKNICYEKRTDMMDHLNEAHGIVHNIPFRKVGRPSGLVNPSSSKPSRIKKQSQAHFIDAEYKFNRYKKQHEAKRKRAKLKEWNAMTDLEKEAKGSRDVFLKNALMVEMEKYMSKKDARMRKIQRRIVEGYDTHKNHSIERVLSQEVDKVNNDIQSSILENLLTRDEHGPLLSRTKERKRKRYCEETPIKFSLCSQKEETPLLTQMHKTQKFRWCGGSKTHVNISDSPSLSDTMPFTLIICNNGIHFESSKNIDNVVEIIRERFESGLSIHFKSQRSSLISKVNVSMLDAIMKEKASTRTMNLFMMWLENTLSRDVLDKVWFLDSLWFDFLTPRLHEDSARVHNFFGEIDMSKHLFLFLPIVDRDHWVLFVLYNNHMKNFVCLPWENHGLIYFNSLHRSNPKHYLPVVQRALQIISVSCANTHLKSFMDTPRMALDPTEIPVVPLQQNATDCGYYVMMYIKRLIDGAYGKRSKSWLTKTWFKQEDVIDLKEGLGNWARSTLKEENM